GEAVHHVCQAGGPAGVADRTLRLACRGHRLGPRRLALRLVREHQADAAKKDPDHVGVAPRRNRTVERRERLRRALVVVVVAVVPGASPRRFPAPFLAARGLRPFFPPPLGTLGAVVAALGGLGAVCMLAFGAGVARLRAALALGLLLFFVALGVGSRLVVGRL